MPGQMQMQLQFVFLPQRHNRYLGRYIFSREGRAGRGAYVRLSSVCLSVCLSVYGRSRVEGGEWNQTNIPQVRII